MSMDGKSRVLFLMITSFNQEQGGVPGYNGDESILPMLPPDEGRLLLKTRRKAYEWLMGDTAQWQGRKMREDRRNKGLRPGPDFGGDKTQEALYRPATRRFKGGHFLALGDDGLEWMREGDHHVLFLCGLYGLITPTEPVQWHNCPVEPELGICDVWKKGGAITRALLAYVRKHGIQRIFDLTAVSWRRNLVDWAPVHKALPGNVLHCFDVDGAEDFSLIAFAELMRDVLLPAPEEKLLGYAPGGGETNRGRVVRFSKDTNPPPKSARADLRPKRDGTDEVDRCRRGLVRLLKQVEEGLGLAGDEHRDMDYRIKRVAGTIGDREVVFAMQEVRTMRNKAVYRRPLSPPELKAFARHAKLVAEWAEARAWEPIPEFDTDWDLFLCGR